jgi:hypothetical protein
MKQRLVPRQVICHPPGMPAPARRRAYNSECRCADEYCYCSPLTAIQLLRVHQLQVSHSCMQCLRITLECNRMAGHCPRCSGFGLVAGSTACIAACKQNEHVQNPKRKIRGTFQEELEPLTWGRRGHETSTVYQQETSIAYQQDVPGVLDCGQPREYVSTSWKLRTRMLIGFFGLTSLTAASI